MFEQTAISERSGWKHFKLNSIRIWHTGAQETVKSLVTQISNSGYDTQIIKRAAASAIGHYAAIVSSPSHCFAITDHCRSSPIFFTNKVVSNDAHLLRTRTKLNTVDPKGFRDASMMGFVSGSKTLFQGLNQLPSGSFALWKKNSGKPSIGRHTIYQRVAAASSSETSLIDDFFSLLDQAVGRIIKEAGDRPIWIALSGGLDSRLLLAKLVEHGHKDLFAFTYGPRGNDEAKLAQAIAAKLGVEWKFFVSSRWEMRRFFASPERLAYWRYSDGLCSLPTFQDFITLRKLDAQGLLPKNALLINGQTGDFISGGHIPNELMANSVAADVLLSLIIKKHYSLWSSLKTPESLEELYSELSERLDVSRGGLLCREEAVSHYEQFEYEERQAKFVINGQRNYEYLDRRWALPLWDKAFVEFWRDVPVELKYNQKLYHNALKRWNYHGLFNSPKKQINHWPGIFKIILLPSRLIRLSFGTVTRDAFLKRMLYFGMYRDQYAPFTYADFLRNAGDLRNPVSLLTRAWLSDLGLSGPSAP